MAFGQVKPSLDVAVGGYTLKNRNNSNTPMGHNVNNLMK